MIRFALVACGLLPNVLASDMQAKEFQKSPGSDGSLPVTGTLSLKQKGTDTQVLSWSLNGIHKECSKKGTESNTCGVHVHEGKTCTNKDGIRGHYWDKEDIKLDPWQDIVYKARGDGTAVSTSTEVKTGKTLSDMSGRAFVVHDKSGQRIACALIARVSGIMNDAANRASAWLALGSFMLMFFD